MTHSAPPAVDAQERLSERLERWLAGDDTTLGGLVDLFGEKSFAVVFTLLMALPALPLPTGGATHVFEIITALGALQLIAGRDEVWIPRRWRGLRVGGDGNGKLMRGLLRLIRALERVSRPRMTRLVHNRVATVVWGVLVLVFCAGAFFAPPFTGLDTLPALGVVLMSLGVLLEDALIVGLGVVVGTGGVVLEITLGRAVVDWVRGLF
ncbi:MAG: exopolysaccharide biosynthesis protein [Thermoleophilia bacterium]